MLQKFCCLILLLLITVNAHAQYSGTVVVGEAADFETIQEAVDAIVTDGVDGPLTIEVETGTYNEQIQIPSISGASEANPITLTSQSGEANDVVIQYESTDSNQNYVLHIQGSSYLTITQLQFEALSNANNRAILLGFEGSQFSGGAHNITINQNIFVGSSSASTGNENFQIGNSATVENISITANDFQNGRGALGSYNYAINGLEFSGNTIQNVDYRAVNLRYDSDVLIHQNEIESGNSYALYVRDAEDVVISNNKITDFNHGIYLFEISSDEAAENLIHTNIVHVAGYPFRVRQSSSTPLYLLYNTIIAKEEKQNPRPVIDNSGSSATEFLHLYNNILASYGNNVVVDNRSEILAASDYNLLYTVAPELYEFDSETSSLDYATTLEEVQQRGFEQNSVWHNPYLEESVDYIPDSFLASTGADATHNTLVETDINGVSRDGTTPSIGAIEYSQAHEPLNLAQYTVGPGEDFEDVHEVIRRLLVHGIDARASIDFLIEPGQYMGRYVMNTPILGTDETSEITFRKNSESGDDPVELVYDEGENINSDNYVLRLTNQQNLSFIDLTFANRSEAAASITSVIEIVNGSGLIFTDNIFEGSEMVSYDQQRFSLVQVHIPSNTAHNSENISFYNNTFTKGGTGLWLTGNSQNESTYMEDILISGNEFTSDTKSIKAHAIHNLEIDGNIAEAAGTDFVLDLRYLSGEVSIVNNIVDAIPENQFSMSIAMAILNSDVNEESLMANNVFRTIYSNNLAGRNTAILQHVSGLKVYNNTFMVIGDGFSHGYPTFTSFASFGCANLELVNNIFYDEGRSVAAKLGSLQQYSRLDHNNYFTNGNALIETDELYFYLEDFQNETGHEQNGLSAAPFFLSKENPVPASHAMYGQGDDVILQHFSEDIAGVSREAGQISPGAYTYTVSDKSDPFSGTFMVGPGNDYESLSAIFEDMMKFGMDGDIIIEITNEITESATLLGVHGQSSENSITIRSESGMQTFRKAHNPDNPYALAINGNQNVTIENLRFINFSNVDRADYLVQIQGRTRNIHVRNNNFNSYYEVNDNPAYHGTLLSRDHKFSPQLTEQLFIYGNSFRFGSYAIRFDGGVDEYYRYNDGVFEIFNNEIRQIGNTGVSLTIGSNVLVEDNLISGRSDGEGLTGIRLSGVARDNQISSNRIRNMNTGISINTGGYVNSFFDEFENLIFNNAVLAGENALHVDINGARVKHNQFVGSGNNQNTTQVVISYPGFNLENQVFQNNIVVNRAGGPLMHARNGDFGNSDYNVFYTYGEEGFFTGISLANSFNQWIVNREQDANSFFAFPNTMTLAPGNHPKLKNGKPVVYITTDINGNARDPQIPFIGPYEQIETEFITEVTEGADKRIELEGSPLMLDGNFNEDGEITLQFIPEKPEFSELPEDVETITNYYWIIHSQMSMDNVMIGIREDFIEGVTDASSLVWLKRDDENSAWVNLGNADMSDFLVSGVSFDSFSEFAIASTSTENTFSNELLAEYEINGDQGWRMLSAPFEDITFANMHSPVWTQGIPGSNYEEGDPNIFKYDEESGTFEPITSMYDVIESARGFITYVYTDDRYQLEGEFPKNIQVTGQEPVSVEDISLTFTDRDTPENDGWNLLGNPFNSDISLASLNLESNPELDNFVYVWDHEFGDYIALDADDASVEELSAFQGFFIKANADEQTIDIPESARTDYQAPHVAIAAGERNFAEIVLALEGNSKRAIKVRFRQDGSKARNVYDAYRLMPAELPDKLFYMEVKNQPLTVKSIGTESDKEILLPIFLEAKEQDEVLLISKIKGLPDDWNVKLRSLETGESQKLASENTLRLSTMVMDKDRFEDNSGLTLPISNEDPEYELVITPGTALSTDEERIEIPTEFSLSQNYPNPFNPVTRISYQLPNHSHVQLTVYDMLGRRIAKLVDESQNPGNYEVNFDASQFSTGMYIYRIEAGEFSQTRKMMLVK